MIQGVVSAWKPCSTFASIYHDKNKMKSTIFLLLYYTEIKKKNSYSLYFAHFFDKKIIFHTSKLNQINSFFIGCYIDNQYPTATFIKKMKLLFCFSLSDVKNTNRAKAEK